MNTPIETNTVELQEILQTVYNLPNRNSGGESSEPDLVIGLNAAGKNKSLTSTNSNTRYHTEDVSIEVGSVSAVIEKLKQNKPVRVLMREINFYNSSMWSRGYETAAQVHLKYGDNGVDYPESPLTSLCCIFYVHNIPSIADWPAGEPAMIAISFDAETGSIVSYAACSISHGSWLV